EEALLTARERPIVLAPRRADAPVAAAVAPGSPDLGVMLPYSPLHHVLLADFGAALGMTNAEGSDEPIAHCYDDACERLGDIADHFLVHDRPIQTRTDDSVVRVSAVAGERRAQLLRRSRGYVPAVLGLPLEAPGHVLACGAELKSTFCVAKGARAWVSHHIGDLKNHETLESFAEGIGHFERLFAVEPAVVAHDLHPDYLSTRHAQGLEGVALVGVQHHHAHLAACLAEHGETGRALGAIFDGTGYGPDGTVWGGELLLGDLTGFERLGMLEPVRMPGGDAAVREPWRMACAWLVAASDDPDADPPLPATLVGTVDPDRWRQVAGLARSGVASPVATSAGRLFDAVAALCGVRTAVNYEGQAVIELEAACAPGERGAYELPVIDEGGPVVLDARALVRAVSAALAAGEDAGVVAARFHHGLADATAAACIALAGRHDVGTVVLSGGTFQNRRLLERTSAGLAGAGLRVLVPERLPANDGGIAYGQAAVATARGAS
ncbi:MAG: Sua5/YciO/YrdC/YwlC family protein, partial [Solirubrobacteraceae bacterium]